MRPPTRSILLLLLGLLTFDASAAAPPRPRQPRGADVIGKPPGGPRRPPRRTGLAAMVGGQEHAVREIEEAIRWRTSHVDIAAHFGGKPPGGFLLVGPPGNGKTALARAVAAQLGGEFFELSGPEVQEHYTGDSEKKLRDVWARAEKAAASGKPAVIFVDEIDAVAGKRTPGSKEWEVSISMQLAVLMDGVKGKKNIIVIGATNRPNAIDPAFRRPGRFDREVTIRLPDARGRTEVLGVHTQDVPLADDVDLYAIGRGTIGYTGADMQRIAEDAGMRAAKRTAAKIDKLLAKGPSRRDLATRGRRAAGQLQKIGGPGALGAVEREYTRLAEEHGAEFTDLFDFDGFKEARAEAIAALPEGVQRAFRGDPGARDGSWQHVSVGRNGDLEVGTIRYAYPQLEGDQRTTWTNVARVKLEPRRFVDPRPAKMVAAGRVTQADLKAARAAVEPSLVREFALEVPHVRWQDVGGNEQAKTQIRRILSTPDAVYKRIGMPRPGGILLYGPPGTGKSLLAKAAATATHRPILTIKASDILSAYHGESNQNLADLLARASAVAPSVVLIDELDSLFARRGGKETDSKVNDQLVGELLGWMDGLTAKQDVLLIATTNRPDAIDPGLRRPGRFDAQVYVGMPTEVERASIFRAQARGLNVSSKVDFTRLAARAVRRSGADIMSIVQNAALFALEERAFTIGAKHLERAIDETLPSISEEDERAYEAYEAQRRGGTTAERKHPIGFSR